MRRSVPFFLLLPFFLPCDARADGGKAPAGMPARRAGWFYLGGALRKTMPEIDAQAVKNLESRGVKFAALSEQEIAKARGMVKPIWDQFVTRGGAVAQTLVAAVNTALGR